jgi:hypothetical protein
MQYVPLLWQLHKTMGLYTKLFGTPKAYPDKNLRNCKHCGKPVESEQGHIIHTGTGERECSNA